MAQVRILLRSTYIPKRFVATVCDGFMWERALWLRAGSERRGRVLGPNVATEWRRGFS